MNFPKQTYMYGTVVLSKKSKQRIIIWRNRWQFVLSCWCRVFFHLLWSAKAMILNVTMVLQISTFIRILDRKYHISTYNIFLIIFSFTIKQFHPKNIRIWSFWQFAQAMKIYGGKHMCNLFALNFGGPSYDTIRRKNWKGVQFITSKHVALFSYVTNIYREAKSAHGV